MTRKTYFLYETRRDEPNGDVKWEFVWREGNREISERFTSYADALAWKRTPEDTQTGNVRTYDVEDDLCHA